MAAARAEGKLTAILAANVVGDSWLVGANELGALARLKALRKAPVGSVDFAAIAALPVCMTAAPRVRGRAGQGGG